MKCLMCDVLCDGSRKLILGTDASTVALWSPLCDFHYDKFVALLMEKKERVMLRAM